MPVDLVPDLMRSAGFYPSESDIDNLLHHVQYMAHSRNMESLEVVTLADLLCLYINHRPLFNVTHADIVAAFRELGGRGDPGSCVRARMAACVRACLRR